MTPGQRLKLLLAERGIGQTAAAALIAEKTGTRCQFHNVHRWLNDREFTLRNQERAARAFGLPREYFEVPDVAAERERETRAVLQTFLRSDAGRLLTPEQVDVLASMRFVDAKVRPTVAFFDAVAANLRGLIPASAIADVAAENARLDEQLARANEKAGPRAPRKRK